MTFPQGTKPRLIQVALAEVGTAETGNNETKVRQIYESRQAAMVRLVS
jgi:hypothetical protein